MFTGAQAAAAIETVSVRHLTEAEDNLRGDIARVIGDSTGLAPHEIPIRIVNGLMRGSTNIDQKKLTSGLFELFNRHHIEISPDDVYRRSTMMIEKLRSDIHIARTDKSAVRQVLRCLKDDFGIFFRNLPAQFQDAENDRHELLDAQLNEDGSLFGWALRVSDFYVELFSMEAHMRRLELIGESTESALLHKPKGVVSNNAARNYTNAWQRFLKMHMFEIQEVAPQMRPIEPNISFSVLDKTYSDVIHKIEVKTAKPATSQEKLVTIKVRNEGANPVNLEKSWRTIEQAKQGLDGFIKVLESMVGSGNRIDFVQIDTGLPDELPLILRECHVVSIRNVFMSLTQNHT